MEREKLKIELIKYENWVEEQNLKEYLKTTIEKTIDNYLSTLPDEKEQFEWCNCSELEFEGDVNDWGRCLNCGKQLKSN